MELAPDDSMIKAISYHLWNVTEPSSFKNDRKK